MRAQAHAEYIDKRIDEVKQHYEDKIEIVKDIKDQRFQVLCLFSLIEALVQEDSNYCQEKEQNKFTDFVLKYQKNKWDFLERTDPVTLFYEVQQELGDNISLDFMSEGYPYHPNQLSGKTEEIVTYLNTSKDQSYIHKLRQKHRYVDLLYRLRCKLSHELAVPGWLTNTGFPGPESLHLCPVGERTLLKGKSLKIKFGS